MPPIPFIPNSTSLNNTIIPGDDSLYRKYHLSFEKNKLGLFAFGFTGLSLIHVISEICANRFYEGPNHSKIFIFFVAFFKASKAVLENIAGNLVGEYSIKMIDDELKIMPEYIKITDNILLSLSGFILIDLIVVITMSWHQISHRELYNLLNTINDSLDFRHIFTKHALSMIRNIGVGALAATFYSSVKMTYHPHYDYDNSSDSDFDTFDTIPGIDSFDQLPL